MRIGESRFEKTGSTVGAEEVTARAVRQFAVALANAEHSSRDAREVTIVITRARSAVLEIDAAAKAAGALPFFAREAIAAIFSQLGPVVSQRSSTNSNEPGDRKNVTAYKSLQTLVTRLTTGRSAP